MKENNKNLYKEIPSHIQEIKDFELNIIMISDELGNIVKATNSITQNGLLIDLAEKIDKIIQVLEINKNYDSFIGKFFSEIFSEVVLVASRISENQLSENKKITSLIELLEYTKDELSKTIKQVNSLDEQSFA